MAMPLLLMISVVENLNGNFFVDQIGKLTAIARCFYQMIIDPMVISTAGLSHQHTMIFKTMFLQPVLRNLAMRFGSRGKEKDDVALVIPVVQCCECIRIYFCCAHSFGFLIWYVVANRTININQVIFDTWR